VDGGYIVSDRLNTGSVRFRIARLIGRKEYPELLAEITASGRRSVTDMDRRVMRIPILYAVM